MNETPPHKDNRTVQDSEPKLNSKPKPPNGAPESTAHENNRREREGQIDAKISECRGGSYRGEFDLRFSGIGESQSLSGKYDGLWSRNALKALCKNLGEGQAVEFRYGWSYDSAGTHRFGWRITGVCKGASQANTQRLANNLYQSLSLAFGSAGCGLVFRPGNEPEPAPESALPWQWDVSPVGIVIPAKTRRNIESIGIAPIKQQVVLAVPLRSQASAFDSVIHAGRASNAVFQVAIRIEALNLSEDALEMLDTTYNHQRFGNTDKLHTQDGMTIPVADERLIEATLQRLRQWSVDPRGFRVRCSIYADRELSPVLIEMIGREVFGNRPVVATSDNSGIGVPDTENPVSVQLTNCFFRGSFPLNLLPSADALETAGARRVYTVSPADLPQEGLTLGQFNSHGQAREVRLPDKARSRHCYIMGATGTGKSTLLRNAIIQDIENGKGVCVIDPHGDLYSQVLNGIPWRRMGHVVLMDLADFEWPIGLNFLERTSPNQPVESNFIVNEIVSIFHRLYAKGNPEALGPVFELYMRNAMLAVTDTDNNVRPATLLDVVRFFEDAKFRDVTLQRCQNPQTVSFWRLQAEKAGGDLSLNNVAPYLTSKLNQFTNNALVRPIIGQSKSAIDFRKMMDDGHIVLVNLSKGLLGERDMRLLGMLLVGKLFNAALQRPQAERRPFYLYIDEFQNLLTDTLAGLLGEARKFGLSLMLANQHFGQLSGMKGVTEAILGNVATMLFFRMGPEDADRLKTYTQPYLTAHDLQHLPDHHVACRMLNNNEPVRPFVFSTFPPQPPRVKPATQARITSAIQERCRRQYAVPREYARVCRRRNQGALVQGRLMAFPCD